MATASFIRNIVRTQNLFYKIDSQRIISSLATTPSVSERNNLSVATLNVFYVSMVCFFLKIKANKDKIRSTSQIDSHEGNASRYVELHYFL